MAGLDTVLAPAAVCIDIEAATSDAVINILADRLLRLGKVLPSYAQAVIARERAMPTGLPLGAINVAIPHTDVAHVVSAALAVATLRRPVLFGSMDDPDTQIPVRVVIAMALTDKNAQIDTLQRVAELVQNAAALDALVGARRPEDVVAAFRQIGD